MARFFAFYKEALAYILQLNRQAIPFREEYTTLVLRKLQSPYPTAYVDLQSPAGAGLSVIVFNYDGAVYPTDESRMLAEMGDTTFLLGNVNTDVYEDIFLNPTLLQCLEESLTYSAPECYECAFQPYCGSDPTYHYATQRDWVGHKAFSGFCERTKLVTSHLIELLEADDETAATLKGWI
jgi:radical SAM protein with 4Fe4S-binding SPASM domain